jgi:hypothetical protein
MTENTSNPNPYRVTIAGRPWWRIGSRLLPVFAGADNGPGGDGGPGAGGAGAPAPPAGAGGDGKGGAGDGSNGQQRSFSQEEVDRIVGDRLARDRQKYADYDDLKAKAAKLDDLEAANKTELERAIARAEKAEQEGKALRESAHRQLIEAAIIAAATGAKAIKPEHMPKLIDTSKVTVGDDGQVTGAEDAVKAFLAANPEYVGKPRPGGADQGARNGGAEPEPTPGLGRLAHAYSKGSRS